MGTPVTIKDPEAVEKSMISGHFNPFWIARMTSLVGTLRILVLITTRPPSTSRHLVLLGWTNKLNVMADKKEGY
eukprot:scaffold235083_cov50-Attheya_sp.AAC.3